jgi:hypothetical protein
MLLTCMLLTCSPMLLLSVYMETDILNSDHQAQNDKAHGQRHGMHLSSRSTRCCTNVSNLQKEPSASPFSHIVCGGIDGCTGHLQLAWPSKTPVVHPTWCSTVWHSLAVIFALRLVSCVHGSVRQPRTRLRMLNLALLIALDLPQWE